MAGRRLKPRKRATAVAIVGQDAGQKKKRQTPMSRRGRDGGGNSARGGINAVSEDILRLILCRVPAETLHASGRIVSKLWGSIIDDPDFHKMHLRTQRRRRQSLSIACEEFKQTSRRFTDTKYASSISMYDIKPSRFHPSASREPPSAGAAFIRCNKTGNLRVGGRAGSIRMFDTCNGLLCVRLLDSNSVVVLNMTTARGISYEAWDPASPDDESFSELIGFGCNKSEEVYKILYLVRRRLGVPQREEEGPREYFASVLTVGVDTTWRTRIIDIPWKISSLTSCAGGSMFMSIPPIGRRKQIKFILSFDIETEGWGIIFLPSPCLDHAAVEEDDSMIIATTGGQLYLTHTRRRGDMDIWVLRGVVNSPTHAWEKTHTIRSYHLCRELCFYFDFCCCWDKGKIFITDINAALHCYDSQTDTLTKVYQFPSDGFVVNYEKTLLCPW